MSEACQEEDQGEAKHRTNSIPGYSRERVKAMKSETMYFALNAIRLEAKKLLKEELSPEGRETLELIISLARYGKDVRDTHCGSDQPSAEESQ